MKNFRILLSMISRNNDMEMPEHGDKAKAYKVMGIIAMCCIMIPCTGTNLLKRYLWR